MCSFSVKPILAQSVHDHSLLLDVFTHSISLAQTHTRYQYPRYYTNCAYHLLADRVSICLNRFDSSPNRIITNGRFSKFHQRRTNLWICHSLNRRRQWYPQRCRQQRRRLQLVWWRENTSCTPMTIAISMWRATTMFSFTRQQKAL